MYVQDITKNLKRERERERERERAKREKQAIKQKLFINLKIICRMSSFGKLTCINFIKNTFIKF